MNQLQKIIETKRVEIEKAKQECSLEFLKSHAFTRRYPESFAAAVSAPGMGVIAEIKRRSPSAGDIRPDLRADHVAHEYEEAGAQAVSILADRTYFGAEESDFIQVRDHVEIPILYKEFVIDRWQIWHASSVGASATLLIAAVLGREELARMLEHAHHAGMEALVEVHTSEEMTMAREVGAKLIGINNRDLTTLKTDLSVSMKLIQEIPEGAVVISESGIRTPDQVKQLQDAGFDGILVGEHLLKQEDPGIALKVLMSEVWEPL